MKRSCENSLSNEGASKKVYRCETTGSSDVQPLFLALKRNANLDRIKDILQRIEDVSINYGNFKRTALHHAISWLCELSVIEELISRGANVNARDKIGSTPLHLAVLSSKDTEYVPLLLNHGADVNSRNHAGDTPLYLLSPLGQFRRIGTIKMLLYYGADTDFVYDDFLSYLGFYTILDKAAALGAYSYAKLLIKTIFLKNFAQNFKKLIEIKEHPNFRTDELSLFMESCIGELESIRKIKINSTLSMLDFAGFGNNYCPKPLFKRLELSDQEFPIYQDVVRSNVELALQRGQFITQCRDRICVMSSRHDPTAEGKEVTLDCDCIEKICSYLTNQEFCNFIEAFHEPSKIPDKHPLVVI